MCLRVEGQEIPCFRFSCSDDDSTWEPPKSEFIAQGRMLYSVPKWEEALVEPSIEFMDKHKVLVARLLVKPTSGKIPLKIVNVSDREVELHKNSLMGVMDEVSIFKDDSLGIADISLVDTPN